MIRKLYSAAVFIILFANPAIAGWNEGLSAYNRGDYATATREWYPLAEQGNVEAQYMLGLMNYEGRVVSASYSEALRWFVKAAEQGRKFASWWVGEIYRMGLGDVPQDHVKAYMWHTICHHVGAWPYSNENPLGQSAKAMTAPQLRKAKQLAHEWFAAFGKQTGR